MALIRYFLFAFRRLLSREVTVFLFFIRYHGNNICFLKAVEPRILLLILIERKEERYIQVFDMVCFVFMRIPCSTVSASFDWFCVFRQSDIFGLFSKRCEINISNLQLLAPQGFAHLSFKHGFSVFLAGLWIDFVVCVGRQNGYTVMQREV